MTTTHEGNGPALQVCIRDHECLDGDILKVSVNGISVMQRELVSEFSCVDARVDAGINLIHVFTVNGTGHKGACDFSDVNTGEISVRGLNADGSVGASQVQSWKIRSNAGSTSAVQVRVR